MKKIKIAFLLLTALTGAFLTNSCVKNNKTRPYHFFINDSKGNLDSCVNIDATDSAARQHNNYQPGYCNK